MAFRDRRIDDVRPNFFEGRERPLFVATHETTVADYVRCEDRRESALHGIHRLVKTLGKCSRMSGPFESTVKSRTEAIEECRWIATRSRVIVRRGSRWPWDHRPGSRVRG